MYYSMNAMKNRKLRGFTLVEMIVAVAVFSVMMAVVAGAFSSGAITYRSSRELQKNVESAQYAMNTMAKHLRTSTIVSGAGTTGNVRFYDYSSNRCFEYRITNGILRVRFRDGDAEDVDGSLDACRSSMSGTWADMTSGRVAGSFLVVPSDDGEGGGDRMMGRVSVSLVVDNGSDDSPRSHIQTSVSLRDYGYVGY